jgi:hypothetical protein
MTSSDSRFVGARPASPVEKTLLVTQLQLCYAHVPEAPLRLCEAQLRVYFHRIAGAMRRGWGLELCGEGGYMRPLRRTGEETSPLRIENGNVIAVMFRRGDPCGLPTYGKGPVGFHCSQQAPPLRARKKGGPPSEPASSNSMIAACYKLPTFCMLKLTV